MTLLHGNGIVVAVRIWETNSRLARGRIKCGIIYDLSMRSLSLEIRRTKVFHVQWRVAPRCSQWFLALESICDKNIRITRRQYHVRIPTVSESSDETSKGLL